MSGTEFSKRLGRDTELRDMRIAARTLGKRRALDEVNDGSEHPWKYPVGSDEDVHQRITHNKIFETVVGRPQRRTSNGVTMMIDGQLERDLVGQFVRAYHKQWGITAPTLAPEETWRRG